jgi:hypothetical protein
MGRSGDENGGVDGDGRLTRRGSGDLDFRAVARNYACLAAKAHLQLKVISTHLQQKFIST